ncbi:MAG TPA: PAP/fibrillin family protein [Oscillatoriales cyanobacterium M59_W2019_021]|nr:PAP/fibrillin family protein [Oscillatoriales cyanobacterium M4454_W2019_049]HIK52880.1 PAP/fibrillin family protein [Oscillatoriales cyanobacterium M59_W2019_021]
MLTKGNLLRELADKNRGINATATDKQYIQSLVAQLEECNPNPKPLEVPQLLEGNWRLLYTTSRELLGLDKIPLFKLGAIYQCIRVRDSKIYNIAEISGLPLLEGIVSVAARFEPVGDRRVNVRFERAISGLQRPIGYQSPNSFIQKIEAGRKFAAIDFQITAREQRGWLDITYLDETMRIGRGNEGSIFVLDKVN